MSLFNDDEEIMDSLIFTDKEDINVRELTSLLDDTIGISDLFIHSKIDLIDTEKDEVEEFFPRSIFSHDDDDGFLGKLDIDHALDKCLDGDILGALNLEHSDPETAKVVTPPGETNDVNAKTHGKPRNLSMFQSDNSNQNTFINNDQFSVYSPFQPSQIRSDFLSFDMQKKLTSALENLSNSMQRTEMSRSLLMKNNYMRRNSVDTPALTLSMEQNKKKVKECKKAKPVRRNSVTKVNRRLSVGVSGMRKIC